ncbi:hypothetical protein OGAPHI_003083 [Ogataea philodendri]|uniref:Uncharacterized protein n=1 Tax=Ogataea philodendri TaxID=1378263 RepID=A0A9P8P9K8_9ASCO|nr:uncharacterized protein OGAPHI_003083 [Ogataea philodendri]KAH3667434.1 hypothetical protein OGAPHI_003083 [Ogataea philodendri]
MTDEYVRADGEVSRDRNFIVLNTSRTWRLLYNCNPFNSFAERAISWILETTAGLWERGIVVSSFRTSTGVHPESPVVWCNRSTTGTQFAPSETVICLMVSGSSFVRITGGSWVCGSASGNIESPLAWPDESPGPRERAGSASFELISDSNSNSASSSATSWLSCTWNSSAADLWICVSLFCLTVFSTCIVNCSRFLICWVSWASILAAEDRGVLGLRLNTTVRTKQIGKCGARLPKTVLPSML